MSASAKVIFLHHSTGNCIWNGGVPEWFEKYNAANGTDYQITEQAFPKAEPYGWNNYPYDYWNIWVKNAGDEPTLGEPPLEILTKEHDVIVFKHCFPVSNVGEDDTPDINSLQMTLANYKLKYEEMKKKLRSFTDTKFIVWTGAALIEAATSKENAKRAVAFFNWVKNEWDEPGDNIFVWDFFEIQTDGGLFFKEEYAAAPGDAHPSEEFSRNTAPLFSQRIVDVIEGKGDTGSLTGKS